MPYRTSIRATIQIRCFSQQLTAVRAWTLRVPQCSDCGQLVSHCFERASESQRRYRCPLAMFRKQTFTIARNKCFAIRQTVAASIISGRPRSCNTLYYYALLLSHHAPKFPYFFAISFLLFRRDLSMRLARDGWLNWASSSQCGHFTPGRGSFKSKEYMWFADAARNMSFVRGHKWNVTRSAALLIKLRLPAFVTQSAIL